MCAGNILDALGAGNQPQILKDGAKIAFALFQQYGDSVMDTIFHSDHANRLKDLVSEDDISFCSKLNTHHILPVMKDGIITFNHD